VDADKLNAEARAKNSTAVFGITVFSDMSQQEFQSQYLSLEMPERSSLKRFKTESVEKYIPYTGSRTSMDWRNMTTPIKDQGQCGSCWCVKLSFDLKRFFSLQFRYILLVGLTKQLRRLSRTRSKLASSTLKAYSL
jgi:Papain family cysteine protease